MEELMLHVLDIAMNAVSAGASTVKLSVHEQPRADRLVLSIADNGPGMSAEMVQRVLHEFATSKTKKKGWVGFGIALLRGTVELVDGEFTLLSRPGQGTLVSASLPFGHWDRPPLGAVAETLQALLVGCGQTDFCFTHRVGDVGWRVDTRPVRRAVGAAYETHAVRAYLMDRIRQGESALAGEKRAS